MVLPRRPRSDRNRSTLVVALLVPTLILTGVLAHQAYDAARSHRAVAERTLHDYAAFAAWELSSALRRDLQAKVIKDGLELAARAGAKTLGSPMASVPVMDSLGHAWHWPRAGQLHYVFRLDLADSTLTTQGGQPPSAEELLWLSDSLPRWAPAHYDSDWESGVFVGQPGSDTEPALLAFRYYPAPGDAAEVLYGFRSDTAGWNSVFPMTVAYNSLLPPSLLAGRENQELLAIALRDTQGRLVYESSPYYYSSFEAVDTVGAGFAELTTYVTLRPDAAEELLIGGLPSSRLPLLLTLLLLSSGLVVAALHQFRREQELAQLRVDFVSGVSHELRTPLAQIRMFAETLQLGRVRNEEERERSLAIIAKESQRLTRQIDNVLLFSRAERGSVDLQLRRTNVADVVRGMEDSLQALAHRAGCEFVLDAPPAAWARVDEVALPQAIYNLLDNAIKYGPSGQTIRVGVRNDGDAVEVSVEDQGPGIPAHQRDAVWAPYHRLQRDRESAVSGSGIGLAVVRQVVEGHGGAVRVEDGRAGARFVTRLPADP